MKSKGKALRRTGIALLALAVLLGGNLLNVARAADDQSIKTESRYPVVSSSFSSPFVAVAERLKPAVVYIKVVREESYTPNLPFFGMDPFQQFFGQPPHGRQQPKTFKRKIPASGSGVIIDPAGYVLTNNHVVDHGTSIKVQLQDGSERDAKVIGTDPETDLALLNIGAVPKEDVAPLGNSDSIRIGDWAIAMGNPMGLDWTLTVGVISAKGRSNLNIEGGGPIYQDFIQTDAAINFGNSGGPLANIHGEVIGINSAINAEAENIGFAIPINIAKSVVKQLLATGSVQRGYLGMVPTKLTPLMREALNLGDKTKGIFVDSVQPDTPAEKGGLKASDIIIAIDGKPVSDVNDFRFRVANHAPGEKMELTVIRSGKEKDLEFKLGNRSDYVQMAKGNRGNGGEQENGAWMGIRVVSLDSPQAQQLKTDLDKGVVVLNVSEDSPAQGKLQPGDVITSVDRHEIDNTSDWTKVTGKLGETDKAVLVEFHPQGQPGTRFIAIKAGE